MCIGLHCCCTVVVVLWKRIVSFFVNVPCFFCYYSPGKRMVASSNAQASHLYKNASANLSSRSSNGDNEDFCSDASLEEDVVDLGHKVNVVFILFSLQLHVLL